MQAITIYYPWCYLWLMDIKKYETRPRGTRNKLPINLLVHCANKKPDTEAKEIIDKYLGFNFKPDYGHLIGICELANTIKITEDFIHGQPYQELELGIWKPGRIAWQATNKRLFDIPIPAVGKQATPWKLSNELIELVEQNHNNYKAN